MNVDVDKTAALKAIISVVAALAVSLGFWYLSDFGKGIRCFIQEGKKSRQRNVRLLCETDYPALLEACRDVSRRFARGELKKSEYMMRIDPDPEALRFPQPILDLEATRVVINNDGRVAVELGGSLHHFGVFAYPEDYEYEEPLSRYGDKDLILGLWYYNDGYHERPGFGDDIDALIENGKRESQVRKDPGKPVGVGTR